MKDDVATFADAAPMLYEHGFNVLPIIPSRKCPPAKVAWHEWRSARQTLDEIRRLREAFQTHDVAIILGRVSSLVDLDVDNGEVGEQTLQALGRPILPTTAFTSPGNPRKQKRPGRHLLYRHHGPLPTQRLGTRLELRADGSYTIVPPSVGRVWMLGLDHLADLPEVWTRPLAGRRVNPLPLHPRSQVGQVPPQSVLLASVSVLLATEGLKAVEAAADFLPRVAFLLGVSPDLGRGFRCPLPGHGPDKRPSATLLRAEDGTIKLHDWHRKDGLEFFSLAEVLAAQRSGRVRSLNGPELATWKLRLLVEAGLVDPIHVDMRRSRLKRPLLRIVSLLPFAICSRASGSTRRAFRRRSPGNLRRGGAVYRSGRREKRSGSCSASAHFGEWARGSGQHRSICLGEWRSERARSRYTLRDIRDGQPAVRREPGAGRVP